MTILQDIVLQKKLEIEVAKRQTPLSSFDQIDKQPCRNFTEALAISACGFITEIKKASPSKGLIRDDFNVAALAKVYEANGATCLSVLTDKPFFQGDPSYINLARASSSLPILRKDFIIDPYQIEESRVLGADCILLIVAILDDEQLLDFCQHAQALQMSVLVESHSEAEFQRALRLPTPLMGVNNRDLHTFVTDLNISVRLVQDLPLDKMLISESGIHTRADILKLEKHGIKRFLIGESLMREKDIGAKLRELRGVVES